MKPTDIVEGAEYTNGRGAVRKVLRIWNEDSKVWKTSVEYKLLAKGPARGQKPGSTYTCALDAFARWAHRREIVSNEMPCGHTYADLVPNPDLPGKVMCSACQGQATHISHLLGQIEAQCDAKGVEHPEMTDHEKEVVGLRLRVATRDEEIATLQESLSICRAWLEHLQNLAVESKTVSWEIVGWAEHFARHGMRPEDVGALPPPGDLCPECKGIGSVAGVPCERCKGTGRLPTVLPEKSEEPT